MEITNQNSIRAQFCRLTICMTVFLLASFQNANSQSITVNPANNNQEVLDYVEDVLLGSCVTVSNESKTGTASAFGTFNGNGTILGLNGGIIITTGQGIIAEGPDDDNNASFAQGNPGDPDLTTMAGIQTYDATILEFDFIPQNDTLRFNYIFGSEEYPEYVLSGYNDAFGFFISGPGISGPFTNGAENIAWLPDGVTPVTIDNVNNGYSATEPSSGPCMNCAYYVDNSSGPAVQYDAYTTVLTAEVVVVPCQTYHIKLAIADAGDNIYDSGVFLEEGSFSAGGGVWIDIETSNVPPGIYEGCADVWFVFRRVDVGNNALPATATFGISGTATPGVDYSTLPTSVTIPAGEDSVLVNISVFLDFIAEGTETITLTLDNPPCACIAPESTTINIFDNNIPLVVTTTGTTTICQGQSTNLTANPSGSQTPYTSGWDSGAPAGDNVTVSPTTTTTYIYTVTDNCGGQSLNSSETVTVIQPGFTVNDATQCFNGNSFSFTNTGTSGGSVTHFWQFGDGNTSTTESPTHSYTSSGSYTATHNVIYTASGCTATATIPISVFDEPILTSTVDQNVICVGGTDGAISTTISGGTATFNYIWSPNGETTSSISNLSVGNYSVVVTDANGCTDNASETIIQNDPTPPNAVCQNITVQLNSGGIVTISATQVNNGSSDNCGIASMVVSPNAFDCNDIGGNAVVLTVTDVNGNVSTCNATVTVEDNINPTALCQNITVQLDASGNATITATDINNGSSDNCSVSISATPLTFTCSEVGANTVVLTATDGSGNTATCNATVTVQDNIDPIAVCQNVVVNLDASGNGSITATQIDNGSSDNCAIQSITVNPSSFDCADIGNNTVLLTVTDVNGNVSTCTATVLVLDNVLPTALCQNITIQLDGTGNASIVASQINNGSSDNCSIGSITVSPSTFDCSNVGANTVTLTVVDVSGNTSTCTATVTVQDNIDPNAVCQNITVQLDGSGNASIVAADVDGGSTDNCAIANLAIAPSTFDCSDVGANSVTLTVTDVNGNVSTCSATVTVEDNVPPIAVCQDITIQLDASGNATISATQVNNGSSDNCAIASMVVSPNAFDCADVGGNTVTLTVNDVNGNSSTCTATVTVEDNINPTAVCQNITVQLDAGGNASITASQIDNGSSGNCGSVSLSATPTAFDCSDIGVNTVTLTVTDANGNASTCVANVTIEDNVAPNAVCQNITVQLDVSGNVTIIASQIDNGSTDNCAIQSLAVNPSTFDCNDIGANTVTLTVTDVNGNVSTCTATVTVEDNIAPTAICQNITVQLDGGGSASITAGQIDNGSTDNCAIATITVSPSTFDCSDVGLNTVTLTVTDVNGNVSTCNANVVIEDNVAPTATCQNITVQLDASGNASITAAQVDNGSADNCAVDNITVAPSAFTCGDLGANTVLLTVTDVNGNASTCTATVTVEDNIDPTAICQNITVQLDAAGSVTITGADIDNGSSDNCAIATLVAAPNSFDCSDVGANTSVLTVTDVSGNTALCSTTVTVEDNISPTAVCQNITVQLDASGNASITAAQVDGGSTDNCAIASLSASPNTFDCNNLGANLVTLTVTDVNGNVSTCTATVTIEDNVPPTPVCQDIVAELDATGNVVVAAGDVDNGSFDNCAIVSITLSPNAFDCADIGLNPVTLTVTDISGNVATCTANVDVQDNVLPSAICQDISVQLDAAGNATITPNMVNNGSSDACGTVTPTLVEPNTFDCSNVGVNTVTLTVEDPNGNISTCEATVTITDDIDPNAVCQDITVQLDGTGNVSIIPTQVDNGSSDNCAIDFMTVTPNSFTCAEEGANTVTLLVVDVNGNSSACTATVTVENNVTPSVSCQDITIYLDASGNASIVASDVDGGSNSACGIASLVVNPSTFDCSDVGANTVTLTGTDNSGNQSTCTATVTVVDNIPPTAVCQDITVQLDAAGNASIVAADVNNASSDNCAVASISATPTTFDCDDVGSNSVVLTVTDVNGNSSTCTAIVTVEDNINPTIICQDITVVLDANGDASIVAADIDNGTTDNCSSIGNGLTLNVTPSTFDCNDVTSTTVTLTATDANGNSSTCTATVTVEDNTAPTALCQDLTIYLNAAGNASITPGDIDNGSSDNCAIDNMVVAPTDFTCSGVGANPVSLTVTDVNGNVASCSATVTVIDTISPTAVCQNITIQLDGSGNASIVASQIDNGSTDICGLASIAVSPSNFNCSDVGVNNVTLTVTDVNGNVSTCSATVTVEDNEDPAAVCQDITVQLDAAGNASIVAADVDGGSTDNCAIASISASPTSFDCSNVGVNNVTLTVTDVNGNVSTCTATVTVEDNIDPTAICQNITVQLDAVGTATITASQIDNGSSDNCAIASMNIAPSSFNCSNVGVNAVTLTVTDVNGNVSTCAASVTVEDNMAPNALCQNIVVQLDGNGNASITASQVDNGSNDNCGIASLSVSPNTFDCDDIGANTVTLTVTDVNGNVSTCTATATVEDNVDPIVICQNITVALDANGEVSITGADIDGGTTDNCSQIGLDITFSADPSQFDCSNVGGNTVVLTATDAQGNTTTCTATVTVEDNIDPTAICQNITVQLDASGNVSIVASDVDNGSFDNCAIDFMTVSPNAFDCSNVGGNTVTLTVTDVNGNSSTCTATVTVEDNVAPIAICQSITVQLDGTGNVSITANDIDNGSSDNCAIASMTVNPSSFTCAEEGANVVTLTVTDVNGNISTCTATVTVENNIIPAVSCQDITIYLDGTGNVSILASDVDGGSNAACGIASMVVNPSAFDCSNVGANTVTLTGTDNSGNVSTCTATVTVLDTVSPTANCQNITVQLDNAGAASIVASDVDNASTDNCAIASLTVSPSTFTCANVGANTVTLTVTDVNGNVSTCTSTVTVEDNVAPIAVCQDIPVALDASGNVSITASQIDNGSSDNCAIASMVVSPNTFDCSNVGGNVVTLTVTDVNGNVSTCTSTVTVMDNEAPTAVCQDITIQLDASGNASIVPADVDNGSSDNCAIDNMVVSPNTFTCSGVGTNPVTLTVTDVNGNVSTCSATVMVEDNIDPTAVCQDITIQLDASGNASIVATQINNGSTDNCAIVSLAVSPNTFDCSNVGGNTVTLTVTDVNGNVSTCTSTVTVEDNVNPIAVCQDITIQLDASGNASISAADVDGGSTDNCAIFLLSVSPDAFTCANVGGNVVTLSVTDVNGNVSTCTANVTVEDNVDPIALCQDIMVYLDGAGNASITASDVDGGSTDNCAIDNLSVTPNSFTCAEVGANTSTLTVTDVNGNSSTCTAIVTVADTTRPAALCQDITIQLDANGNASIVAVDVDGGSTDNCAIASLSVSPNTFDCSNIGANTVTLTVTDVNGNVSTCTSTVTVEDNIDPIIICQDITVQLDASGNVTITGADIDNGTTDNCSTTGVDMTVTANPSAFDCSNVGANTVVLTATDAQGNTATCTATVTVEDNIAPTAICQDITVQLDAAGNASITASQVDNGSSDNCAIDFMTVSPNAFDCSNVGGNTVTLTVTDVNGNSSTCTATVTVEDNVAPIAICQSITVQLDGTGNVSITANQIDNGSSDNCAIASMTVNPSSFTCAEEGANTVTLTVTDVNGNVSTCTATVMVENNVVPTVSCQDITIYLDGTGNVSIIADDVNGGSNASCGLASLTVSPDAFTCANVGTNTVVLTAIDNSGNSSTCTATVTVLDTVSPTAVCQDITIQLDNAGNASIVAAQVDGGSSDNCVIDNISVSQTAFDCSEVGANTVTLTVTDVNGNVSTCTATVTVEDNVAPIAVCQDIPVALDASGNVSITASQIDNGSTDNCAIASMVVSPSTFDCSNVGGNVVTLTVTDVNGNVSTCTFTVTVMDNEAPIAVCQDITIQLDAAGNASILPSDIDNGSSDNCAIDNMTVTPNTFTCAGVGANPVTLIVTDVNGNISTCSATVTVEDNVAPIAACQDITIQLDASGNASIVATQINNGSTDNCAIASLAVSPNTFNCTNVGANTVTLTVTDVNGNVSTCTSTVTVEDNIDPIAVCQDITIQLDANGDASIVAADVDGGSSDNCSIASLSVSPSVFNCTNVGGNLVTLTVTDVNGNTTTCTANVTVEDNVDPIAVCQDITIQLDASGNASIVASDVDGGSTDNCAIASLSVSQTAFDCSEVGANTVTLTVTDVNGNVSTCTATVTVEDNVDPIAICQDITVQLDGAGNASIVAADVDNGSSDNCSIASLSVDPSTFDCSTIGANTVTLTVTDVNGNVSTCTSTVTVEDNVDPVVICQDITVELDANGEVSITGADLDGGTSDNCDQNGLNITFSADPSQFDCSNVGTNTVTLTATDVYGNSSTCTATVTVEDNINPTAVCQDITVQLDASGNVSIVAADVDNGSFDNCAIDNMTVSQEDFVCSEVGANTVTLTVTDVNANVSTCTATVTVEDNVAPIALCQDITVQLDATGNVSISANDVDNGSSDNCAIASMVVSPSAFTCAEEGANTVTLTVTDVNGNVSTCTSTVTVENNVAPNVFCQDITVYLDANGDASIIADDVNGGSNASCGLASLTVSPDAFDCSNIGANTVTLTAVDNSGNTSTCTATVSVLDTVSPTAVCQNITIQLDANGDVTINSIDIDGGSSDNCGIASITIDGGQTTTSFDCSDVGANTVTLTVTDVNGNVSTCDAIVTVEDIIDPTAICQDITVQLSSGGVVTINSVDIDGGSSDNCGIASITVDGGQTTTSFDCSNIGTNTITLTVTDVNGNVSTCDATVTVEDNIDPTAICQNITVQLDANGDVTISSIDMDYTIDGGSFDNCGIASITIDGGNTSQDFDCSNVGTNVITLTVTDVNGNVSTCDATVTIEDNIDPTAVCQNITIQLDANGDVSINSVDIDGGSFDNCGIASITIDGGNTSQDFDCSNVGTNVITLTVTDVNGNVSTCDATVTVEDAISPSAICQDITVQLDATGTVILTAADIDGGSTDNCGIASLSISSEDVNWECVDVGVHTVTLTVTDVNGNVSTCDAQLTVENNQMPTLACTDITVYLDGAGNASITPGDVNAGANASCGLASIIVSPDAFDCSNIGPNTITLTATDSTGNITTCTAIVTVEDTISPTTICQDITIQLDANGEVSINSVDIDGGSFDNCGIASITIDGGNTSQDFDCSNFGTNVITLTVTDVNGNVSTCDATVTIEDNIDPTAVCQDITIQLDANGNVSINSIDIDGGSFDNCGIASITIDGGNTSQDFDCSNIGTNTITLTVTDVNGNVSTCDATVTIEDNIDPTAVCQNITIQLDANGEVSINSIDIDGGSFDNCGIASITIDGGNTSQDFDCSNVGTNTITLTVTDVNGNASTCDATVTIEDNIDPTAVCQNITIQLDANGEVSINSIDIDGGSFDNCGIASITIDGGNTIQDFDCSEVGTNTITLTVTDVNGNVSTCDATVTIEDNIDPTAVCQDITIQLDANGNVSINSIDIDGGSFDNCGIASITIDGGNTSQDFDCSNVGTNVITLTVTDVNGNISTCDATVTIEDNIDPTAICQNITVQLDANGDVTISSIDMDYTIDGGSFDNCGIASITIDGGNTSQDFDCSNVGTNVITLTITDVNGNVSTCDATVIIEDNIDPTAVCQNITIQLDANGEVSINSVDIDGGSFDNCGIASITIDGGNTSQDFDCSEVGTNVITLTVTDVNGNVSTCDATVTIQDTISPTVICQDITIQLDATGTAIITAVDLDGGSSDNCGIASFAIDAADTNWDCTEVGTHTVTLTVTDVNGNVSTCDAQVTVENNEVPTVSCQDITVYLDGTGNVSITAGDVNAGANASCGLASLVVSPDAFDCSNVGANTVILTATDNTGNVSTCTATVTVLDTIAPAAICQNIFLELDANGDVTFDATDIDGGSSDNCGIATITVDGGSTNMSFDCSSVGTNTVTLTVTDVNGNVSTCDATVTVTVEDNINPTAVCADITAYLDANGEVLLTPADVDGGSFDNCAIATIDIVSNQFDCTNFGTNSVVLTITDSNGNTSTCISTVTVEDTISPIAICQNIIVQLDVTGNATIAAGDVDNGSFDNCGIASLAIDIDAFDCSNIGPNTVTLTVTDVNGNVSNCTSTATVVDAVDPLLACQNITVQLDANGLVSITAADVDNGSTDACGIDTMVVDITDFDCSDVGVNQVTLTVTDVNGNFDICQAVVTVEDTVPPTAVCQDMTIQLDATGSASILAADVDGGSFDNCAIDAISVSQTIFDCSEVGANTVTLTVVDVNGNTSTCEATVTVEDNVPPIANCQDITVYLDNTGNISIEASDINAGSNANCGVDTIIADPNTFTCAEVGNNTVTLTVIDNNGNSSTCTANVEVLDTISPIALCQDITVQLDANGQTNIVAADVDNGSFDNCAVAGISVDQTTFDCSEVGVNTVTLTVTDVNGNISTCTTTVTVKDTVPPIADCAAFVVQIDSLGIAVITPEDVDNNSSDNCAIASLAVDQSTFDCSEIGINTVELTVTDVNGNTSTCSATVIVEDNVPPVTACQDITIYLDANGQVAILPADVDAGSTDNCAIDTMYVTPSDFTCSGVGANPVTLTVTDVNNNTSSCFATVTVLDTISPIAICQDITIQLDSLGNASIDATEIDNGSNDACGVLNFTVDVSTFDCSNVGANTVVLTVEDNNGNISTCAATVTIEDNVAPIAICQDLTIYLDENGAMSVTASEVDGGSTDNCGIDNLALSQTDYSCADLGQNIIVLTVTDVNGNTDDCSTVITVIDTTLPEIIACPLDILVVPDSSDCTPQVFWTEPTADDNCSVTLTSDFIPGDNFPVGTTTVTYTATDQSGNSVICTFEITIEPTPVVVVITTSPEGDCGYNLSCNGAADGEATANPSGGCAPYNYLWTDPLAQITQTATGLDAGSYAVTVTDANGTSVVETIVITEPDVLSTDSITSPEFVGGANVSCNGAFDGAVNINVIGGSECVSYGFAWTGPNGFTSTQEDITGIEAGTYVVTVSDVNGCSYMDSISITEPNILEADVVQVIGVTCFGESNGLVDVNVIGGSAPYSYDWSNSTTDQDINGVPAGTYSLEVTDANGCTDTLSVNVNEPDVLTMVIDTVIDASCGGTLDGSVTVLATGGTSPYIYQWPNISQSGPTATGLSSGIYEVEVTDDNGCSWLMNVFVGQPSSIDAEVTVQSEVSCNGSADAEATVNATGGTSPYTYLWSNNDTISLATGYSAGTHTVTVTDAAGCDTTLSFTVIEPDLMVLDWDTIISPSCFGFDNGQLEVEVTGGTVPYDITWSNNDVGYVADNLAAGSHTVYVADANGCMDSLTVNVPQPDTLQVTFHSISMVTCFGGNDGEVTVEVSGGTPTYTYDWPMLGQSGQTASDLEAGWHMFVTLDANGCNYTDSVEITSPNQIVVQTSADTAVCPGNAVTISVSATGGAGNYSYSWDNGLALGASHVVTPTETTTYHVEVFDQSGCSALLDSVIVSIAETPVAAFSSAFDAPCALPAMVDFANMSTDATGYEWIFGNGNTSTDENPSEVYDETGTYTVTLIASSGVGCADTTTGTVVVDVVPTANFTLDSIDGCAPVLVDFGNNSSNGASYFWDFGDGTTSDLSNPIHLFDEPGTFDVTLIVSSLNGCTDTLTLGAAVTVYPSPTAGFDANQVIIPEPGNTYDFTNNSTGGDLYNWDFGNGDQSDEFEASYEYPTYGEYWVTLTTMNEWGCLDTAMQLVRIELNTGLFVPNAMAVGEPGEGGIFLPKGTGLAEYHVWVFDSWGNLIWESQALDNGSPADAWDGRYKGNFVPQGSYVWKVNAIFDDGKVWDGMDYSNGKTLNTGSIMVFF